MINKKEAGFIALIIIIISFSLTLGLRLVENFKNFFTVLIAVSLVILFNIFAKKITAYSLDAKIETKIWEIKIPKRGSSKTRTFSAGSFFPLISKIILFPLNNLIWMACLVFDVTPRIYRGAKRFGLYTFSEMTEAHIGLIAASGIVLNLILAWLGYILGFTLFARISLYYAFFNILPLSDLDGNKIFFGNKIIWSLLASIILIGLFFSAFII